MRLVEPVELVPLVSLPPRQDRCSKARLQGMRITTGVAKEAETTISRISG
jgi:hypothetical protein